MAAQLHFGTGDSIGFGTTGTTIATSTSFNKTDLANVIVGDLLVAFIHDQSGASAGTITPPSGWTRYGAAIGSPTLSASRNTGFFYYPIKSQTDIDNLASVLTWTFTATGGRIACVCARATGIDLDNIEDSAATQFSTINNNTSLGIGAITTANATTLLVGGSFHANAVSTTAPSVTSFMTGYQEYRTSTTDSTIANSGAALGYSYLTSAGSTGSVTVAVDSSAAIISGELVAFRAGVWTPPSPTRPTIEGTATTYVTASAVISFSIAKPGAIIDGDLLVLALSAQSPTVTSDFTSSGWTRISRAFEPSSSGQRLLAFYALPVPTASGLSGISTFTFTSTDSASGGRIAAEMFVVRGADLTNMTTGMSPYASPSGQTVTVAPDTPTANKTLLLVAYNAQFTSAIDYTIATGPSAMTQHIFLPSSTAAQSKTILAVYQEDVEASAPGSKALTWNGVQSQTTGVAVSIRNLNEPDVNPGKQVHFTSAADTLTVSNLFYTSATDTLSTPTEVRAMPTGYPSVANMLATSPFYIAHRGGSDDWPEMSLYAYTQSVFWGVGALEVSLQRTSDGVWFGLHDATLDRTSGTTGFTASAHTWAEVQAYQITLAPPNGGSQPSRPYMRWEEIIAAYYGTHVIMVDPKNATGYFSELLDKMDALSGAPTDQFIVKYFGTSSSVAAAARARGYKTWGYFYQADVPNLPTYQGNWDLLGMDYSADSASWTAILSYGKPVIGHTIPNATAATTALGYGASGLMVSGIQETVSRSSNPIG